MAQVALFSKGIVYDTDKQTAQLHQVVDRFTLGDGISEKCVITEVFYTPEDGYLYTMIGLTTFQTLSTRFVFSSEDSAIGIFADLDRSIYMDAAHVPAVVAQAAEAELLRQQRATKEQRFLHPSAVVVEYSEKCLAVFTMEPSDKQLLEGIRAKRNPSLNYQGRKAPGWIIPKCRQQDLAAIVPIR